MKAKKIVSSVLAGLMLASTALTPIAAADKGTAYTDENGHWHYEPLEQGTYSNGGYTIDKVSYPTNGPDELDSILNEQERGQSYSWSMAEGGDYIYIGTCYNSTFYIYHNALKTALTSAGVKNADKAAEDIIEVVFGVDAFDETKFADWDPVIISVNKYTYEVEVVFRESELRADMTANPENHTDYKDKFTYYPAMGGYINYISGYRMAVEFNGKIYFAGMGNPTATLVEVDPETNTAKIAYAEKITGVSPSAGHEGEKVANGVHGLVEYDGQLLMCLATSDYDGDGSYSPGGIIVASDDPTKGLESWDIIADQDDFDGLPAVLQTDGLNGGGIWDIIEYNGYLYVTIVTDTTDLSTGEINKQGFAMYRGEKEADGEFTWTQVVGDNKEAKMPFGLGVEYSMSCNLWTYEDENGDEYLYLGTYNDPMLDLNAVFSQNNYELLYNDLDHSIYLYRMDENENFEQIGGKDDNPEFPDGPIGNLGAGLGNNSNQYVWRYGEHDGELLIGTYDTSSLTYIFTQVTDGQIEEIDMDELEARSDKAIEALLAILGQADDSPWNAILDKYLFNNVLHSIYTGLCTALSDFTEGKNPVPTYREKLEDWEELKDKIYEFLSPSARSVDYDLVDMLLEYELEATPVTCSTDEEYEAYVANTRKGIIINLNKYKELILKAITPIIEGVDSAFETLSPIVYYFGVSYYGQQAERGFDLLISNDGVNFDALTRDGFGSGNNHGLRTIESTDVGVFFGTANPFQGTQLWLMQGENDNAKYYVVLDANGGSFGENSTLKIAGETGSSVTAHDSYKEPTRSGYDFIGWATSADATEADANVVFGDATITYYAVWQKSENKDPETNPDPDDKKDDDKDNNNGDNNDNTGDNDNKNDQMTSEDYKYVLNSLAQARYSRNDVVFVADDCGGKVAGKNGIKQDKLSYVVMDGSRISYVPSVIVAADYEFAYWYSPETEKTYTSNEIINMAIYDDITFIAVSTPTSVPPAIPQTGAEESTVPSVSSPELDTVNSYAYLTAQDDGAIMPDEAITRGEVATLLFRLLTEESREAFWCRTNDFSDVSGSHPMNTAISTIANAGIINGYPDGTFRPDAVITRAEFASVMSKFTEATGDSISFTDTEDHWAADVISRIAAAGWINGYGDGSFRPDGLITRAEAVKILNSATNRTSYEAVGEWSDVSEDAWYYGDIQAAAAGTLPSWKLLESPLNLFYFAVIK